MKTLGISCQLVEEFELKVMSLTEGGKGPFGRLSTDSGQGPLYSSPISVNQLYFNKIFFFKYTVLFLLLYI